MGWVLKDGRKMPSGFAVCFKRGLVDHTVDPDSVLHDDVLCFDHHAVSQKTVKSQSSLNRSRSWT